MLEKLNKEEYELEKERILLLFEKEKYNLQQKKWFLEAKIMDAKKNNNVILLNLYEELDKEIQ